MAIKKTVVGTVGGVQLGVADSSYAGRFTQEELEKAFKKVQNKDHWKGPIAAFIPATSRDVTAAAIEHFTGTEATFEAVEDCRVRDDVKLERLLHVRAPGYWAGPCN